MSKTVTVAPVKPVPASTKDTGRVQIGSGMMRYTVKVPGKTTVTHDAGRVQIGSGMMRF